MAKYNIVNVYHRVYLCEFYVLIYVHVICTLLIYSIGSLFYLVALPFLTATPHHSRYIKELYYILYLNCHVYFISTRVDFII